MHLCIEVDGESHQTEDARQYDQRRDQYLRDLGIHTLRFWNDQVRNNLDEVVKKIDSFLIAHSENSSETRPNP
jgi:very-short-patch-repair endonuclease